MNYQSSNDGNREEAAKDTKDDFAMFYLEFPITPQLILSHFILACTY